MPHIFERRQHNIAKLVTSLEEPLAGTHKVTYRAAEEWDFEGFTESAPIDLSLAMPPHRPKHQPEDHRTSMSVSSERGPINVKVCRYALNRPFNLEIVGGTSDVTVWVPSNFRGYITYSSSSPSAKVSFSAVFVEKVFPSTAMNRGVPKSWNNDQIAIATGGNITFRVWDVITKAPETQHKRDVWRKVFGGAERRPPPTPTWNWDFLIEDDD